VFVPFSNLSNGPLSHMMVSNLHSASATSEPFFNALDSQVDNYHDGTIYTPLVKKNWATNVLRNGETMEVT